MYYPYYPYYHYYYPYYRYYPYYYPYHPYYYHYYPNYSCYSCYSYIWDAKGGGGGGQAGPLATSLVTHEGHMTYLPGCRKEGGEGGGPRGFNHSPKYSIENRPLGGMSDLVCPRLCTCACSSLCISMPVCHPCPNILNTCLHLRLRAPVLLMLVMHQLEFEGCRLCCQAPNINYFKRIFRFYCVPMFF